MTPVIKLITEFVPLAVFFIGYKFAGLPAATAGLMVATVIAVAVGYYYEKRIAPMPLVSGCFLLIFGGLTLLSNNELFIKIKPTLANLTFAALLLGGLLFRKNFLQIVMHQALHLSDHAWRILAIRWGLLFLGMAALNEIVWRHFPTDVWVQFKVFGFLPITLLFSLAQIPFIRKHWQEK